MSLSPQRSAAGFTLIEVMVVVVIIGILVGFAVLSIGNRSLDDRLDTETRRLEKLIALASEEAELQGIEIGLRFNAGQYEFLTLSPEGAWAPLPDAGALKPRAVPPPLSLTLFVEGRPVKLDANDAAETPQIQLLSSGEASAYVVELHAPGVREFSRISGDALGRRTVERIAAPPEVQ